ncbi:MAG: hypothetical protein QM764_10035 [Chitinophagaceae bacterium]
MAAFFSKTVTSRKWTTFLLAGLSLSVGWGIRGNFGHEYGAAFAGSLAAIAMALLSGREDWRNKVSYFALFSAIGWGFGASVSYMQVIAYAQSGDAISQWYGYFCLFIIGFLWAAIGGIGTSLPAVMEKDKLVKLFTPLLFVLASRIVLGIIEDPLARWLESGIQFDDTASRHKNPLYWFDAYYLPAFSALFGIGIYDLWQRKAERNRLLLPLFVIGGALVGYVIQFILQRSGLEQSFAHAVTYVQGDPSYINPQTGLPAYQSANLLNNWPQWFGDYPQHVGWIIGCILGFTIYFLKFGKFRNGASLIVYMAGGWLIGFICLPVLGGNLFANYGGIRMTPPRSDDWAGIVGLFIATMIWLWKNNYRAIAWIAIISGTIGGLGFAGIEWIKTIFLSFGNPDILIAKGIAVNSPEYIAITTRWANWQAQNWHSFLEQSYGFVNGIAIAVSMALLASRIKIENNTVDIGNVFQSGRWAKIVSTLIILFGLIYVNIVKNVEVWSSQLDQSVWTQQLINNDGSKSTAPAQWDMPYFGRLPGMNFLQLSPESWFTLTWLLLTVAAVFIVRRHLRNPIAVIPKQSLGKGQLIFLLLLWIMNIANFERALTGWHPSRLLTEWVIFVNTIIVTALILTLPRENENIVIYEEVNYKKKFRFSVGIMAASIVASSLFFTITNRLVYHYPPYDELDFSKPNMHTRFGPQADWRTRPNLKNAEHK